MLTPDWLKRWAVPIADKIVYSSNAYVDLKSTLVELSPQLIDFERQPGSEADLRLIEFARLVKPFTGDNLCKVRVGASHDGGYVMADDFSVKGAVSIGIGSNVSWDQDIVQRQVPVAMFDPTIRRLPDSVPGGWHFRVGLGPANSAGRFKPLPSLVDMAGFKDLEPLILKIDVEGSEYESLADLSESALLAYRQICIEFHNLKSLKNRHHATQVIDAARKLCVHHYPIHIHGNNYDSLIRFGDLWFPNAIEVSYLNKERLTNARSATSIRHAADSPCDPRASDFDLEALCRL